MSNVPQEILQPTKDTPPILVIKQGLRCRRRDTFAILTFMDGRLDPAKFVGLAEGDAHVIRNAGGRASDDAIRSLVISHKLLGTQEVVCHSRHQLRHGILHQRRDAWAAGQQPGNSSPHG